MGHRIRQYHKPRSQNPGTPATQGASGTPTLVFTTPPPTTAQSGIAFTTNPVVQLTDGLGNHIAQAGVTVSSGVNPAITFVVLPSPLTTDANGTATVTSFTVTGTAGSYTVSFTAPGYLSVSQALTITAGTPNPANFTATVPNGTQNVTTTITIQARDSAGNTCTTGGNVVTVNVNGANTAGGNAVDNNNGTYTFTYVPANLGTDTVTITADGVAITGSPFTSQVSAPSTNPFPNQPTGMTQWVRTQWDVTLTGTTNSEGWNDASVFAGANVPIVTTSSLGIASTPVDPPLIMQVKYPSSVGAGGSTARLFHSPTINTVSPNTGTLYVSMWVYVPSSWTWNGNPGGKFISLQNSQGMNNIIVPTGGGSSFKPGVFLQNTGGFASPTYFASAAFSHDAWVQFEWVLTPNTPGVANGTLRIAINGTFSNLFKGGTNLNATTATDLMYFAAGQTATFPSVFYDLVYGGAVAAPPTGTPIWWALAETYISVK